MKAVDMVLRSLGLVPIAGDGEAERVRREKAENLKVVASFRDRHRQRVARAEKMVEEIEHNEADAPLTLEEFMRAVSIPEEDDDE